MAARHSKHLPLAEKALRYGEAHGKGALASATEDEIRAEFPWVTP